MFDQATINVMNTMTKEEIDTYLLMVKVQEAHNKSADRETTRQRDLERFEKEEAKEKREKKSFWAKAIATVILVLAVLSWSGKMMNTNKFEEITGFTPTEMYHKNLQKATDLKKSMNSYDSGESISDTFNTVFVPAP